MSDGRPLARGLPWSHKRLLTTMTKGLIILSTLTLILGGVALALRLTPAPVLSGGHGMAGYGVHEGRQLVVMADGNGNSHFAVCDAAGNHLFNIPLRDCTRDVRFRGGRLRFRENATGREGYIDRLGQVCFEAGGKSEPMPDERAGRAAEPTETAQGQQATAGDGPTNSSLEQGDQASDLRRMARSNPFYAEAAKVLSGKLTEEDAGRRSMILRYCEHLRTAYTTKDIDFIKQVFSDRALIIVGNVVRTGAQRHQGRPAASTHRILHTHKKRIYQQAEASFRCLTDHRRELFGLQNNAPPPRRRNIRREPQAGLPQRPLFRRRLPLLALGLQKPVDAAHPRAHMAAGGIG